MYSRVAGEEGKSSIMYDSSPNSYHGMAHLGTCCSGTGTIHLALHKPTDTMVVVKKFYIDDRTPEDYNLVEREIIVTRQLQHPNVLPYLATFVSGHSVCVVSPPMGFGSCQDLIEEHFPVGLPEVAVAFILKDVLQGLEYIHKRGFVHRAIKASHILISSMGQACLSGMRYACEIVKNGRWQKNIYCFPSSTANNLKWLSPELLLQDLHGYNEKSDIYSLGITICELANGVAPFTGVPATLMLTEKVRGRAPHIIDCKLPKHAEHENTNDGDAGSSNSTLAAIGESILEHFSSRKFSESFHSITVQCLHRDPSNRPSTSQLSSHPFFKQCRKSDETVVDIFKSVPKIGRRDVDSAGDYGVAMSAEQLANLDLQSCHWDF
ncbi:STE20-related kinase adapter protein alpha [Cephus cinctus]|uniref:STE20-related kinase adapter protein alpha n=1 Tax=Cephus cinctus TaxID=211228 RepID=A0AAJ7C6W0_CEPCN|nr:STE20-related kinase adapter protein alpha [Cephus cinctus]